MRFQDNFHFRMLFAKAPHAFLEPFLAFDVRAYADHQFLLGSKRLRYQSYHHYTHQCK